MLSTQGKMEAQAWANCESGAPDAERQDEARRWNFLWDIAGSCWRCSRCLVTVQQFKNLKRHCNGVKCRQRSGTLACQSNRQILNMGGFTVRYLLPPELWAAKSTCCLLFELLFDTALRIASFLARLCCLVDINRDNCAY